LLTNRVYGSTGKNCEKRHDCEDGSLKKCRSWVNSPSSAQEKVETYEREEDQRAIRLYQLFPISGSLNFCEAERDRYEGKKKPG
jgi:hypothetical protein